MHGKIALPQSFVGAKEDVQIVSLLVSFAIDFQFYVFFVELIVEVASN